MNRRTFFGTVAAIVTGAAAARTDTLFGFPVVYGDRLPYVPPRIFARSSSDGDWEELTTSGGFRIPDEYADDVLALVKDRCKVVDHV
jgi:hypothetical protein